MLIDDCCYLLKDGRYIQIQSCSNEDCYVYYFIENKEIVNDGIIQNVVLQRIPELILDCRIVEIVNANNIEREIYVVHSIHFVNYELHYRIGQKYIFRISKLIPHANYYKDCMDIPKPFYLAIGEEQEMFLPTTYVSK